MKERNSLYKVYLIFIAGYLLLWLLLPRFLFQVKEITVVGNQKVSLEELSPYISSLIDKPLYRLNSEAFSHLTSEIRWIKKIVAYKLPPYRLVLFVRERVPFLLASFEENSYFLVDDEGVIIEQSSSIYNLPILIIRKTDLKNMNKLPEKWVKATKELLKELEGTPIVLKAISLSRNGEMEIETQNGLRVIFGRPEKLFQKVYILKTLWNRIPNIENRLLYIDLSCPQATAIMEKRGEAK